MSIKVGEKSTLPRPRRPTQEKDIRLGNTSDSVRSTSGIFQGQVGPPDSVHRSQINQWFISFLSDLFQPLWLGRHIGPFEEAVEFVFISLGEGDQSIPRNL